MNAKTRKMIDIGKRLAIEMGQGADSPARSGPSGFPARMFARKAWHETDMHNTPFAHVMVVSTAVANAGLMNAQ